MPTHGADFPGKSLKIKLNHEKTKDMEAAEEDYHGGASVSVPFMWESQPGTPKVNFRENGSLRSPLTPPPSYFSCTNPSPKPLRKSSKTNFLNTIFRKRSVKASLPSSPTSTSSSSSSSSSNSPRKFPTWSKSSSVPSSSMTTWVSGPERLKARNPRRLSFDSRVDEEPAEEEENDDDEINIESPVSTLFFGRGANEGPRGCYPKLIKVFMKDLK